jgi:hypothetical protein
MLKHGAECFSSQLTFSMPVSSLCMHCTQRNAATELGELLLDSLEEQHRVADEKTLGMLVSIADAFPPSIEQIIFLKVPH